MDRKFFKYTYENYSEGVVLKERKHCRKRESPKGCLLTMMVILEKSSEEQDSETNQNHKMRGLLTMMVILEKSSEEQDSGTNQNHKMRCLLTMMVILEKSSEEQDSETNQNHKMRGLLTMMVILEKSSEEQDSGTNQNHKMRCSVILADLTMGRQADLETQRLVKETMKAIPATF
ncbi:uncharacterized protein LOC127905997 isoform X5 [Oncorhynchus keta]|uniref:uncharacterized protein LOC127905997 isoform X5 n=1 Tax=Oncorhynchus keta TaxID=8018 RepID=UPI00227CA9DB|nr:uncharacterized protein LOC127905997 isoform X5 [Oncorhynchus keta]